MRTRYCLGFLFCLSGSHVVVLIKKNRPEWQAGLLNGVGGKVEAGEHPGAAMRREFLEETGVEIKDWTPFAEMIFKECDVYCFAASDNDPENSRVFLVQSMTEEEVGIYSVNTPGPTPRIPNLQWLIPMALSRLSEPRQGVIRLEHS